MTLVQVCRSDSFFHQHFLFSITLSSLLYPNFLTNFIQVLVYARPRPGPSSHCLYQWFFHMVFRQDHIGGCKHTIPKRRTCWIVVLPLSWPRPCVYLLSSLSGFRILLFFSYRLFAFYLPMRHISFSISITLDGTN